MSNNQTRVKLSACRGPVDLTPYGIPHPDPFVCSMRVDAELLNPALPHVSNIEYVRWLDGSAELHSDSLGYTRRGLIAQGMLWFVARHEIDYCAEAWEGDEIVVVTWVRDFSRVRSWRDYVIVRPADETVICRAATLWVLVDLNTRRPLRVPAEMIDAFRPLVAPRGREQEADSPGVDSPCTLR
ncbi:MAG: acyl-CoA thioesterase [Phycisphaerales bacterium]|nr:MAG: acyl-CoA thioesterase [Phycisphaerales bacterium]